MGLVRLGHVVRGRQPRARRRLPPGPLGGAELKRLPLERVAVEPRGELLVVQVLDRGNARERLLGRSRF